MKIMWNKAKDLVMKLTNNEIYCIIVLKYYTIGGRNEA